MRTKRNSNLRPINLPKMFLLVHFLHHAEDNLSRSHLPFLPPEAEGSTEVLQFPQQADHIMPTREYIIIYWKIFIKHAVWKTFLAFRRVLKINLSFQWQFCGSGPTTGVRFTTLVVR